MRIKKHVPIPLRRALRYSQWAVLDAFDAVRGANVPPRKKRAFVGEGDFEAAGKEHLRYFVDYGGMTADDSVLEVGCGIGRMALPLTAYLSPNGRYEGFDPNPVGIEWCAEHITPRFPNFHFHLADVRNDFYNPTGKYVSEDFQFPYPSHSFDFVFLTSVFTHLFPAAMRNYFNEVNRVLKNGGKSFITFFLLNPESRALIEAGKSTQDFVYKVGKCVTTNESNPEAAIAFEETEIREMYAGSTAKIVEVKYGTWCGRTTAYTGYQDAIIARKMNDDLAD